MSTATLDRLIDPGVDANRHSTKVFRYQVKAIGPPGSDGSEIRGRRYRPGDIILLSGHAAYREAPFSLTMLDPVPVEQTEDPATWKAQSASSLHVWLNKSQGIHHHMPRIRAHYAGPEGTARVSITFSCGEWFVESNLTMEDALRIRRELGEALEEMKDRMFSNPIFDDNGDEIKDGDLYIHQMGGSF
jgi:hypothetical protein